MAKERELENLGSKMLLRSVEDVFNLFEGLIKTARNKASFKELENQIKESGWSSVGSFKVNEDVYPKLMKEMKARGLLFSSWEVEGTDKICVFYNPEFTEEIKNIMSAVKLRVGLEIDSKTELEAILSLEKDPEARKMVTINGIDPVLAEKAIKFAEKMKTPIIMVKNKEENGLVSLNGRAKDKKLFYRIISEAAMSLSGVSGKYEEQRTNSTLKEKEEIEYLFDRVLDEKEIEPSYIFSSTFPKNYIKVEDGFFEVHNGDKIKIYSQESNPENYYEILKFKTNRLDNPTLFPEKEVLANGGPESERMKNNIKEERTANYLGKQDNEGMKKDAHLINFEKKYEFWLINKIDPETILTPKELGIYAKTYSPDVFMKEKGHIDMKDQKSIDSYEFLKRGYQEFNAEKFSQDYSEKMKDVTFNVEAIEKTDDFEIIENERDETEKTRS